MDIIISEFFEKEILGNTIIQYCWFAGIILAGLVLKGLVSKISSHLLFRLFKNYSKEIKAQSFLKLLRKPIGWLFFLIIFYIAFTQIDYPSYWKLKPSSEFGLRMVVEKLYLTILISTIIWGFIRIADFFGLVMMKRNETSGNNSEKHVIIVITETTKVVIIILGVFVILGSIFNINIGSLIAGLGIGGLAVALAAKDTLENFFGSFSIFLDKPFVIGDHVTVGNVSGIVEKIGFRSTRIRTLEKTSVAVPNKKMVDVELENLSLRTSHYANYTISLDQNTSLDTIKSIIAQVKIILAENAKVKGASQVKLIEISKGSFDILVQYDADTTDHNEFLSIKEQINFDIIKIVKKHNANFASLLSQS